MGSGRSIAGNISAIILAVLGLLGYLPWLATGLVIIAIAVIAILPSSKKKIEDQTSPAPYSTLVSAPVVQHQEQHHVDQKTSHLQNRPIQRLPQAIIEALRPVPTPRPEEKIPELDTGRPVQRVIPSGDYESLEYGIHEGEELTVDVQGDGPLNVYVLTEDNLNSLDSDQEFWYEMGNEGSRNTSLKFSPEESGTCFLVIENTSEKDVTAMLKVAVRQPAHPVPLLKSEKLDLPEQRATGGLSI